MPHKLSKYSGIILNQNQVTLDAKFGDTGAKYRQEFFLPPDYRRGTESGELRYPALSGLQLFVDVTDGYASTASFDYNLEYQVFGLGWIRVAEGVAIGAPSDNKVWMTAYFQDPVEIDEAKAAARWRFNFEGRTAISQPKDVPVPYANGEANVYGNRIVVDLVDNEPWPFTFNGLPAFLIYKSADKQAYFSYQQGVHWFWFATPNPLALPFGAKAYDQNGTPLTTSFEEGSFCFRILALTAEDGIDFLGNQYRSVVTQNKSNSISTALGADRDSFWLSKPNPSKFAVENLYFDVRQPVATTYGTPNMVLDPSFEPTTRHAGWTFATSGATATVLTSARVAATDGSGSYGYRWQANSITTGGILAALFGRTNADDMPVIPGQTYSAAFQARIDAHPGGSTLCRIEFFKSDGNATGGVHDGPVAPTATGTYTIKSEGRVAPADAVRMRVSLRTSASVAGNTMDFTLDKFIVVNDTTVPDYFDGDMEGYVWAGTSHSSASYPLIEADPEDSARVIDRVLVDPVTPGAWFNIYYTNEGDPGTNEASWDNKLWIRVPQTYRMERRETHVLPEPISARYVKIEFSHLQARHYAPGVFQQAVRYKKHPKWVLDYFLARTQEIATNPFLAERVAVIHDALDLAYNYYLDDLGQEPAVSVDVNNTVLTEVTNFLSDRSDASDRIDPGTLDRIGLILDPYRLHPVLRGVPQTILGDAARQTVDLAGDYPVEQSRPTPIVNPDVSTLNRDRVVIEQNYPVMFFFLTCRHAYREVEAKFTHDRAYFAGIRELAFLRDNYMTAFDASTYIEPAADTLNVERNEFV